MSKSVPQRLQELVELHQTRGALYRDDYIVLGQVMAATFPEGLTLKTPEDFTRFHLFTLLHGKLGRYAKLWEGGHPDSLDDLSVYAQMLRKVDDDRSGV